ncbi:MAG: 30S ribosomal protein S13 [Planctomycetes bacterium SM23_32]|nr:MAG: 30S ribosomal protein S13 [Planctomycetes bacterium SM23_32]
MPRLVGVDIPADRRIAIALTSIYGIGRTSAQSICEVLDVDSNKRAHELTEDELSRIAAYIDKNFIIEGELRRLEASNIARLRQINCYRGIRHRKGLPVRGQRTRTNARTRKGKKRTVAGKKGVKELGH